MKNSQEDFIRGFEWGEESVNLKLLGQLKLSSLRRRGEKDQGRMNSSPGVCEPPPGTPAYPNGNRRNGCGKGAGRIVKIIVAIFPM